MAIDLCSENSGTGKNMTISPRISFSYDLHQSDTVPVEQILRSFSSSSTIDFNFCVQQNPDHHQATMADELFSDGKIIPTQIKQPPKLPPQSPPVNQNLPAPVDDEQEQQNPSRSFWGFKRSSSCGNGYGRSLCPIPLLSRSNSTGSSTSTNSKRSSSSKEGFSQKHHHNFQKPPLRKANYSYGNNITTSNGVRVNPVLNLGFGSFFSSGKKK